MLAEKSKDDNDKEFRELFLLSNKSIHHATQLINPLSRETINLPTVDTYQDIKKLLLLTNNDPSSSVLPLVVVLWGYWSSKLVVCRPGDNKWIHVQKRWDTLISDVTYYNRRLYTLDGLCNIKACDVYGEDPMVLVNVARLIMCLYDHKHEGPLGTSLYIFGWDDDKRNTLFLV
nr:hypothetical protein [Tanacetum cinerariifolium]